MLQATVGALYGVDGSKEIGDVTLPAVWVYGAAATDIDDDDRTQKAHINTQTHRPISVSVLIVVMMDDYQ